MGNWWSTEMVNTYEGFGSQKKSIKGYTTTGSTDVFDTICKKLHSAGIYYDREGDSEFIKKFYDKKTMKNIFMDMIKETSEDGNSDSLDLKPKLILTEIKPTIWMKLFAPNHSILLGFVHAIVKIGPIVIIKKRKKFFNIFFFEDCTLD